jgi:hypothetical protein
MRNIESKFERTPQKRIVAAAAWIRMLRIIDMSPSVSAAC